MGVGGRTRNNSNHSCRNETGRLGVDLLGEEVGNDGSVRGKPGGQQHAHIPDVDGDVEGVKHVVHSARSEHEA